MHHRSFLPAAAAAIVLVAASCTALAAAASPAAHASTAVTVAPTRPVTCFLRLADPSGPQCLGANKISGDEEHDIAYFEGPGGNPILHPYNDQLGYCTIGLGHLIHKSRCTKQDFKDWKGQTAEDLIKLFHQDIAKLEAELNKLLIGKLRLVLDPCQYDGLFDLYFNGGPTWFQHKNGKLTQLTKALKAGDMAAAAGILEHDVPAHLKKRDKKELSARRKADAAEFRTRRCPCKIAPVSGTFSGTQTNNAGLYGDLGGVGTWTGTFDFNKPTSNSFAPGNAVFVATSGTVKWKFKPTGTLPSGCTWTTLSGSLSDPAQTMANEIRITPAGYFAAGNDFNAGNAFAVVTCHNNPPTTQDEGEEEGLDTGPSAMPFKNGAMSGSFTFGCCGNVVTWTWSLHFDALPPVTP